MSGKDSQSSGWEKANCLANIVIALAAIATTIIAGVSVWFLYTQTPFFEGTRPQLTYHVERSNGTEKNGDGLMRSMVTVKIHNASNYPAKDVHVVLNPLGETGWAVDGECPIEELRKPGSGYRIILVKLIQPNTSVSVVCAEMVAEFPERIESFRGMASGDDVSAVNKQAGNKMHIIYAGRVTKVYTETVTAIEQEHLNADSFKFVTDDYRSAEGLQRLTKLINTLPPKEKVSSRSGAYDSD